MNLLQQALFASRHESILKSLRSIIPHRSSCLCWLEVKNPLYLSVVLHGSLLGTGDVLIELI